MEPLQNCAEGLRPIGIEAIGQAPWGTHFCQFYATKDDLIDTLVPYFKAGLESGEFCMWITSPPLEAAEAWDALSHAMPDLDTYRQQGRIEILSHADWYLLGGVFDQDRVLKGWVDKLEAALERGCAGLRLSGNTFWLEKSDWSAFVDYESAVDSVLGQYRMIALCTYSLERCGAAEVADVIRNHEFALIKRDGRWEQFESFDRRRIQGEARAERERLLRASEAELREVDRRKNEFLAALSHELRNPLAPIRNSLYILERTEPGGEQALRALAVIQRQFDQISRLVDDLLDLTRISRGKIQIHRDRLELNELVRIVVEDQRSIFEENAVRLEVELASAPLPVSADGSRLVQVIANLLQNAAKFTSRGGTTRVKLENGDGRAIIRVSDDGVGMAPETVASLFEPFSQADHSLSRSRGGLGLGLALVKGIVELHGGEVSARSGGLGLGSEFVVRLPLSGH